jgi:3-oxoacyl-[acyl-carrier-protein] synthase II
MVVVTGIGAASALGTGVAAHRAALWAGRDGFRPVDRFDTSEMSAHIAATWPGWDGLKQPMMTRELDLAGTAAGFPLHELALVAAREAWAEAAVTVPPRRAALVFGTCYGQGFKEFNPVAERIAAGLGLMGPCVTISTACASSTNAIGLARDLVVHGHADVVVAGGADTLLREAFAGFSALGVLSPEACAPFSDPPGTTMGEGAAFVVLERAEDAARRKAARVWASICGYGLAADGYHETTPDPAGGGLARSIRGALRDAGFRPSDIDYVSAHATGTANNDRIEWSVIERDLGGPQVSGAKGHFGHTQGAAGALELVLALICHREGHVPPTLHFRGARPGCPADPIAAREPRPHEVSRALKLSAAFGGANAVVAYSVATEETSAARERAKVVVTGAGVVGPAGARRLAGVLELTGKANVGSAKEVDLDGLGVDGRRLDRSARWLTTAAALALSRERPEGLEGTGLFVASTRMPAESSKRCSESIRLRGIAGTSASAFARMTVNGPAGACTQALGLLGPTSTLSSGEGSGLLAVVLAAEWLAFRDDASCMVAGAVDELSGAVDGETEGAACLALERAPAVKPGMVVVAGWGMAGSDGVHEATKRAMSGLGPVDCVIVDGPPAVVSAMSEHTKSPPTLGVIEASRLWGAAEASRSCVMATVAAAHIAAGHAQRILIVAARGATTVALVLEAQP